MSEDNPYEPGNLVLYDAGTQILVVRIDEIDPAVEDGEVDAARVTRLSANEGDVRVRMDDLRSFDGEPGDLPAEYLERVSGNRVGFPDEYEDESDSGGLFGRVRDRVSGMSLAKPDTIANIFRQAGITTIGDVYSSSPPKFEAMGIEPEDARHIHANAVAVMEGEVNPAMRHRPERVDQGGQ